VPHTQTCACSHEEKYGRYNLTRQEMKETLGKKSLTSTAYFTLFVQVESSGSVYLNTLIKKIMFAKKCDLID
jgi:hypothetical protein